ncbi:MAG: Yip1 family protein [Pseudomonadota bacterium]
MLQDIARNILDSYIAPRRAAQRVLNMMDGYTEVVGVFALSYALTSICAIILSWILPTPEDGVSFLTAPLTLADAITGFVATGAMLAVFSFIIFGVGRVFGGEADLKSVLTVVSWHSLVTFFIMPLALLSSIGGALAPLSLIAFALALVGFWMFASFIAEAHKFQSTLSVVGGIIGVLIAGSLIFGLLAGALVGA